MIGGPCTRSMEGVHGPGVHVLYFPIIIVPYQQLGKIELIVHIELL